MGDVPRAGCPRGSGGVRLDITTRGATGFTHARLTYSPLHYSTHMGFPALPFLSTLRNMVDEFIYSGRMTFVLGGAFARSACCACAAAAQRAQATPRHTVREGVDTSICT